MVGSIANAKTQAGKPAQLNFNLTGQMTSAKKHTHMVFMRPDVDTHIGGGKWVEVDDNGNIVNADTLRADLEAFTGQPVPPGMRIVPFGLSLVSAFAVASLVPMAPLLLLQFPLAELLTWLVRAIAGI